MISLTWNILMVINDEASWWKYAEILLTNTRHSGQRGKVFPPQILFAKFQRRLNSFWDYIIQEMSFASFQWIGHIYSFCFCFCVWHRVDLRLCKYDKNSFGGIGRISVGLKSARCWDFPVTKKRQSQKRRKKKRGKRRGEGSSQGGTGVEILRAEMFFSGRTKKILTVKQDLRHRIHVEKMSQREENVSARNMCCEESCSSDHMWTFQALNQQELNSRFFSNILANIIFTSIFFLQS